MRPAAIALLLACALPLGAGGVRGVAVAGPAGGANGADQCLVALADTDLVLDPDPELPTDDPCDLSGAVEVLGAGVELGRPFLATCDLAAAFDRFEREVLQPAAERHLGRRVARVEHSGSYRCSYVAGGGGRRSEHATANALDVHAFVLEDGESVSVLDDWDDPGPAGAFLREVGRDACRVFSAVLGPSYNRLHHDHLHFDLGPYDICSES